MNLIAANIGSYPRIGDKAEQQKLRVAMNQFRAGGIKEATLNQVRNEVVREVLEEQSGAGLDVVSDGQVRWHDPVSHFMRKLGGVNEGHLVRYFDTNTFLLQPQVTAELEDSGSLIAEEIKLARTMSARPVAARLTGPLTLSRMSSLKTAAYPNADALMAALVPILAAEVARLVEAGASLIVVEEPMLLREPAALPRLIDALEVLAARRGALKLMLSLPFGDATPLYEALQRLPVDGLMLDLTCSKSLLELVEAAGSRLSLGFGLVDARRFRLETSARVAVLAERLLKRAGGDIAMLMPSAGLEFLPRQRACEKLTVLARARDLVMGTGRGARKRRPSPSRAGTGGTRGRRKAPTRGRREVSARSRREASARRNRHRRGDRRVAMRPRRRAGRSRSGRTKRKKR